MVRLIMSQILIGCGFNIIMMASRMNYITVSHRIFNNTIEYILVIAQDFPRSFISENLKSTEWSNGVGYKGIT